MKKKSTWVISDTDPILRKCLSELGRDLIKQFINKRHEEIQSLIHAVQEIKETKPTIH